MNIVIKISTLDFTGVQQGTKRIVFITCVTDNKFTTINQQNAQICSLDILYYNITIFLHILVRKGPSPRNQTKAIQFKPSLSLLYSADVIKESQMVIM